MQQEHKELLRFFFRKWSTIELSDEARIVLRSDVASLRALLEVDGVNVNILSGAEDAPDRNWFASKYHEVVVNFK